MKNELKHLPKDKRDELRKIKDTVVKSADSNIAMIILFGKYAKGNISEKQYIADGIKYKTESDYDLLFVVNSEETARNIKFSKMMESRIEEKVKPNTPINIMFHGIDYLNSQLEWKNYFFTDIVREGVLLYQNEKYDLKKPAHSVDRKVRLEKAEKYYEKWFKSAESYFEYYKFGMKDSKCAKDIFQLNQTVERYYTTIMLVLADSRPKSYDIEELDEMVSKLDMRLKTVFPRKTDEEKECFEILKDASDPMYKDDGVEREKIDYIAERVQLLRDVTKSICEEKIEEFKIV